MGYRRQLVLINPAIFPVFPETSIATPAPQISRLQDNDWSFPGVRMSSRLRSWPVCGNAPGQRCRGTQPSCPRALPASTPARSVPERGHSEPGSGPPRPRRDLETGHSQPCRGRREGSKAPPARELFYSISISQRSC